VTYIQYDAADLTLYGPDHDDGIYMISTDQGNWKIWSVREGWISSLPEPKPRLRAFRLELFPSYSRSGM